MHRCVSSRNLKNEEAMARVGPQGHKKKMKTEHFETTIPAMFGKNGAATFHRSRSQSFHIARQIVN